MRRERLRRVGPLNAGLWVVARLGEAFSRVDAGGWDLGAGQVSQQANNSMQLLVNFRCDNESDSRTGWTTYPTAGMSRRKQARASFSR
jgi:hypothetical protein